MISRRRTKKDKQTDRQADEQNRRKQTDKLKNMYLDRHTQKQIFTHRSRAINSRSQIEDAKIGVEIIFFD